MTYSFNLIDQPWIPCTTLDGGSVEVGLYDLLAHAHELREIACETPLMTSAILPVTLAMLHRIFGPTSIDEWEKLWRQKSFPTQPIQTYVSEWYDRFDLFHPERPFYQARDERVQPKSILYLAEQISNTHTLFDHRIEEDSYTLTAPEAARTLITAQYFRLGGGNSGKNTRNFIDSTLARGILFFAAGHSLFETLMLNLFRYPWEHVMPGTEADKPIWEQDISLSNRQSSAKQVAVPKGYLDYLTWQTNNIHLLPSTDGETIIVQQCSIAPIMPLALDVKRPQKLYLGTEDKEGIKTWRFLSFNSNKALWRDYHSLVTLHIDKNSRPPTIIEWLNELEDVLDGSTKIEVCAVGRLTEKGKSGKPQFYRQERLPLPLNLIGADEEVNTIGRAVNAADAVAVSLQTAVKELAAKVLMRGGERKPDGGDVRRLAEQWDVLALYWARLEAPFWEFVHQLSQRDDDAYDRWEMVLRETARAALEEASQMSGTNAAALHGQVIASRKLNAGIKKALST